MPVHQLLGGRSRDGVMVYGHANGRDHGEAIEAVGRYIEMGYKAIRVQSGVPGLDKAYGVGKGRPLLRAGRQGPARRRGVGHALYLRHTPELFRKVRDAYGYDHHLLHDGHHRMTPIEAARLGRDLEPFRLFWLEDATPAENQEAFRLIRSHTTTPLAVGEIFSSLWDCKDLIQNQLIDYIRATIMHAGGITHLRRIADFAALHQVRTGCHGATDLSPVSMAAARTSVCGCPISASRNTCAHRGDRRGLSPQLPLRERLHGDGRGAGPGRRPRRNQGRQISVSTRLSAGCAIARWHRVELVGETRDERSPVPARRESLRRHAIPARRAQRPAAAGPSLGLWQNFGADTDPAAARALLLRAFDLGITHFDLANNYGPPPGAAEALLGEVLASELAAHRDELIISTKAGYRMWPGPYGAGGSRKSLLASLDQSLKRMRIDHVDIFYSHRFDPDTPLEETMGRWHPR